MSRVKGAALALVLAASLAGVDIQSARSGGAETALSPPFTRSWTWVEKTDAGYRFSTTLQVGNLSRLSHIKTLLPGFSRGVFAAQCEFNPRTDALMPASLSMTNLTRGFSTALETTSLGGGSLLGEQTLDRLWLAASYSNGFQCDMMTAPMLGGGIEWDINWSGQVAPGRSVGPGYAYLIIHNYYTPNHPKGDPQRLRNAQLTFGEIGLNRTLVSIRGPGVPPLGRYASGANIPLDGR